MPWLWSVHDEVNQHYRRYVSDQLESLIRDADLVLSSTRYWGSFLAPLAYLGRRLQKKKTYKVSIPPAFLNKIMVKSVLAEYSIMTKINIPMGLSLMAVAQKNEIA
jgi:hypothetical protein